MNLKQSLKLQADAIPQGLKNFIYNSIHNTHSINEISETTHLDPMLIAFIVSQSINEIKQLFQEAK